MPRLPFALSIPEPCQQPWHEMSGTPSQRLCAFCNKTVHNLANLTPHQIERLIHESNGHLCARITRREDGSLETLADGASHSNLALLALSVTLTAIVPGTAFAQSAQGAQLQNRHSVSNSGAQSTQPPSISGLITDSQGALIVGANVELSLHGTVIASTKSDGVGHFAFTAPTGDYDLTITAEGFKSVSKSLTLSESEPRADETMLKPETRVTIQVTTSSLVTSATIGELSARYLHWYQRLGYRLRHPVAYAKFKLHHD